MMASILKTTLLISVFVSFAVLVGCDEEKKTVCCRCECYATNTPAGEDDRTDTQVISGENYDCVDDCRAHCSYNDDFNGWELRSGTEVKCPNAS